VVEVVRVEDADDVACGAGYAAVHGIVEPLVLLREDAHTALALRFVFAYDGKRVVRREPVFDDEFPVLVRLLENALQCVAHRGSAVERGCYDGYLH